MASIKSLEKLKIKYATVHLLNGLDALVSANEEAKKINIKSDKAQIKQTIKI